MTQIKKLFMQIYFLAVMSIRNIRWIAILIFKGSERPWPVLDFKMYLTAHKAGIDPKEKSIFKQLILDGVRERKSTEIMQRFVKPDDVILELGANIGYYVLVESKVLSENGLIYAVEPELDNFNLLKRNATLNNVKNIETFNIAISDKTGTAKLYIGGAANLHSLIKNTTTPQTEYVEVQTDTVDNFLKDKKPVTFLRMDIEGYETEIIEGMHETLKSPDIKRMFVEIHPHRVTLEQMQQFLQKLKGHGFETAFAVSRDKFQRSVLNQSKVEKIPLTELMTDERLTKQKIGFELFLERD